MVEREISLWRQWKKTKSPETLASLLKEFEPLIKKMASRFSNPVITQPILEAEAKRLLIQAFEKYNPKKGSLPTFAYNYLKKLRRFVLTHQNIYSVPESQGLAIRLYQEAVERLENRLNRAPSIEEIADELKWSKERVAAIKSILEGGIPESSLIFAPEFPISERATLEAFYQKLNPKEKVVFEHLTGYLNQPILPIKGIAKKLKMPKAKVFQIREEIINKAKEFFS
ncbi:MAG: sigma-70 domain-containing protein [Candidatus Micrarchaeia archaeon]